ncbi:crossover junction endodeoxyribonuclease RuvC [Flavihumibacter cheonanensis]|uniref:crossover junction endodeoxyribonuclease RuvC n=1 Tax=Flavihumibacter cheonanensis TaxID=1442385 RepID=UPI001EF811BB|nr:crossover junction endodeoxyribonuclease RuvC [Flavihumibacter cheonanensis]MCG7753712.1 crossover junction endodeoxyribonuclease RuvC [Flavihumibacter cheonanensis]
MKKNAQIILGIDPGTIIMGYGLIAVNGQKLQLLHMDVLKLNAKKDQHIRLELIHRRVAELIQEYQPTSFAIEAPFFGKNVQSMLKLGRAQGVAIAAAIQAGLEVCEYSPKKVKQSITGNGNADKHQVWSMLQRILTIEEKPEFLDASDALAVAICHHYQTTSPIPGAASKLKGWEDFLKKNEHRIRKPV